MKAILPSTALALTFAILANALLVSGIISYGNDTALWDIPYRSLASALASQGDLPLWYPGAGNGFPQLNLQWVSWVFNPLGILLSMVHPYDHLSFAIENTVWRALGFAGAFVFARQWTGNAVGATAIAATYVGSGVMSWAALSYSAFIGQMFAPWVLASGSLAIRATSSSHLARASGTFGVAYGLMVWCAYPGAWLTAPVLSGPILIGLALAHRGGMRRLLAATALAGAIALMIIGLLISETTSLTLIEGSVLYSRQKEAMREGLLRGIDLAGLLLANPSYGPSVSSALLHPIYSGILPVILLTSMLGSFRQHGLPAIAVSVTILGLAMANLQNWTLWDHPLFREVPALKAVSSISGTGTLVVAFALPLGLSGVAWSKHMKLTRIDAVMLGGMAWVLLVSGDNPLADFLRFNIPPFVLVRYNHLYFWLVTLLATTLAWRRIEQMTEATTVANLVPAEVKEWGTRLTLIGVAILLVTALVAITSPDSHGLGAPSSGISAMGFPHLAWQATILIIGLAICTVAVRNSRRPGPKGKIPIWAFLTSAAIFAFLTACLVGVLMRSSGTHSPVIPVRFSLQLALDLAHGGFIVLVLAILFARARSQTDLRVGIASIMILDISLAVPRYFSDNNTAGASQPGWPYPPFETGRGRDWFLPRSVGTAKHDFNAQFSAFSPPPPVTRLRTEWGTVYDTWVLFPAVWSQTSDTDVVVTRESLMGRASTDWCSAAQQAEPIAPAGNVNLLLASKVDSTLTVDCDRLLVFTDSWAPGWSATIDGIPTPVLRVNNAIRGVMVPAGEHALQWRYRPRFLAPLLALLATGLAISGLLIASPWWSRRYRIPMPKQVERLLEFSPPQMDNDDVPIAGRLAPDTSLLAEVPGHRDMSALRKTWPLAVRPCGLTVAIPLTGFAILIFISFTAYDPRFDGPTQGFRLFLFRSVLAGLWAWIVIAGQAGYRSAIGPSIMLLVLLPPLVLQMARHTDSVSNGMPVASITTDFRSPSWQDKWDVTRRGNEASVTGPTGFLLRNDGGTATAITLATKPITQDLWAWWRRPLGRIGPGPLDVAWTAILDRSGPYFTVATIGRLTIQALNGGCLVTAPVPGGDVKGDFIETLATGQPGPVRWLLRINPDTGSTLSLNDRQVWMGGHPGVIERVTLGDASNDPEHRGSMTITDASIVQRVSLSER